MTALREKMLADLQLRNYSQQTIDAYLRQVAAFARHFGKSPDRLGPSQVRDYQLFLLRQKRASWPALVQTVAALRFFYRVTLGRKWMVDYIPHPRYVKPLPTMLSQAEVQALLRVKQNLKHRALLTTIYAARHGSQRSATRACARRSICRHSPPYASIHGSSGWESGCASAGRMRW